MIRRTRILSAVDPPLMIQPLMSAVFQSPRFLALQDHIDGRKAVRNEAVPRFNILDCTLGCGIHTEAMLEYAAPYSRVVALDCDSGNAKSVAKRLERAYGSRRFRYFGERFSHIGSLFSQHFFDAIVVDPGPSASQLHDPTRGFAVDVDDAGQLLDMRYGRQWSSSALRIINECSEPHLWECTAVLANLPNALARRVTQAIIAARPIESVAHLFAVLEQNAASVGDPNGWWEAPIRKRFSQTAVSARFMHALRALVNHEREELTECIRSAADILEPDGRLIVFTRLPFERQVVDHFAVTHPYMLLSHSQQITPEEAVEFDQPLETTMHVVQRTQRACFDIKNLALEADNRADERAEFYRDSEQRFTFGLNDAIQSKHYPARNFRSSSLYPTKQERRIQQGNADPPPATALRNARTRIPRK